MKNTRNNVFTVPPKNTCPECKSVIITKKSKTYPYCYRCFCYKNPNTVLPRRYKLKENIFFDAIQNKYSEHKVTMIFDKKIDGGCSRKRPDIFIDCLTHVICGELDENKHNDRDEMCENRRIMELFGDNGERPIIVLRLNPDKYYDENQVKHESCFSFTKSGIVSTDKKEWNNRLKEYTKRLDFWLVNIPEKEVTIEKFFYGF